MARYASGKAFLKWLTEQGIVPDYTSHVIIDVKADDVVRIYVEMFGAETLMSVEGAEVLKGAVRMRPSADDPVEMPAAVFQCPVCTLDVRLTQKDSTQVPAGRCPEGHLVIAEWNSQDHSWEPKVWPEHKPFANVRVDMPVCQHGGWMGMPDEGIYGKDGLGNPIVFDWQCRDCHLWFPRDH